MSIQSNTKSVLKRQKTSQNSQSKVDELVVEPKTYPLEVVLASFDVHEESLRLNKIREIEMKEENSNTRKA